MENDPAIDKSILNDENSNIKNDPIVESILKERYYQPGENSWEDIAWRVANFIGNNDTERERFYEIISNKEFIPNSPCLFNAGTNNPQMSACFTIPVHDSIESIFNAVKNAAIIHATGGGTGFNFSEIRSNGSIVNGTGHYASGPVSFMSVFNSATDTIIQGGKRRGANLGSLDVSHPDILEFINCKSKEGSLKNFNISVNITDEFMNDLNSNVNKKIWSSIIDGNWNNGEPGLIFTDNTEKDNNCKHLGKLIHRNPCQEFVGLENESCNLGSINLLSCIDNNDFNWKKFQSLIESGVIFLNNVIDKNNYPIKEIEEATKKTRKIGLGVMGFADLLIALNIEYGSEESFKFVDSLFSFMRKEADLTSESLSNRYGTYPESVGDSRRNASVLSIAPTGSISIFAEVSSGIEPNFGWIYKRSTWVDGEKKTYDMIHPLFKNLILNKYKNRSDAILQHALYHGTISNCSYINDDLKRVFVTAKDISPINHIRMQAVIQKHVDQAISKTINCLESTTKDEIAEMIKFAWKLGCKGLTIYRDGSRNDVVLETNATKKDANVNVVELTNPVEYKLVKANGRILPKTPRESPAVMYKRNTGCGKMMIAIGEVDNRPHSITIVNKGGCDAMTQAVTELTSLCERFCVPQWNINKVLMNIKCPAAMKNPKSDGKSCPDIIGKILNEFYPHDEEPPKDPIIDNSIEKNVIQIITQKINVCPDCGEELTHESGCRSCIHCGYTKCS